MISDALLLIFFVVVRLSLFGLLPGVASWQPRSRAAFGPRRQMIALLMVVVAILSISFYVVVNRIGDASLGRSLLYYSMPLWLVVLLASPFVGWYLWPHRGRHGQRALRYGRTWPFHSSSWACF